VKEPLRLPPLIEHDDVAIEPPPLNEQVESVVRNPEPDTETVIPTCPIDGVSVIVGGRSVNAAAAVSPTGVPVAVMIKGLPLTSTLPTTNVAVRTPPEMEQRGEAMAPLGKLVNKQDVSPDAKPDPDT
jgi:hypothetical protein